MNPEGNWTWRRADIQSLALFTACNVPVWRPYERLPQGGSVMDIARAIYEDLANRKMEYKSALASSADGEFQEVKRPYSLLCAGKGQCVDISILYAALCFDQGLVPILVSFEGHMMVAIACDHWQSTHSIRVDASFYEPVKSYEKWKKSINAGEYFMVECNGLLDGSSVRCDCGGGGVGYKGMCFNCALKEGKKYLENNGEDCFRFAVDVSSARGKNPEIYEKGRYVAYDKTKLLHIFRGVDVDTDRLKEAYRRSCSDNIQPMTIEDCICRLEYHPPMAFHSFLLYIKTALSPGKATELDAWIREESEAGNLELVKTRPLLDRPVLLIKIWASSDGRPGWLSEAYLFAEAERTLPIGPQCDDPCLTPDLPALIERLFTLSQNKLEQLAGSMLGRTSELLMELMLPDDLLDQNIESWLVPYGRSVVQIGKMYSVALRSYDRIYDVLYNNTLMIWSSNWKAMAGKKIKLSDAQQKKLCDAMGEVSDAVPVHLAGASVVWLAAMINDGAPVAIWLRGESPPRMDMDDLVKIVGESPLKDLPWQIQKSRRASVSGSAPEKLALLFDDPSRLPPDRESRMQEPR